MTTPPPVPAASTPVPPPISKTPFVIVGTGMLTISALSFLTELWAAFQGEGGSADQIAIIFGMHGDGTLSSDGVLTVTESDGRPFVASAFTDTTDASNITTGEMSQDRVAGLTGGVAFADLPAPAPGLRNLVTDSTVVAAGNFGAAVAGGGANIVPVWSDGVGWFIG